MATNKHVYTDVFELNEAINKLPRGTRYHQYGTKDGFVLVIQNKFNTSKNASIEKHNEPHDEVVLEEKGPLATVVTAALLVAAVPFIYSIAVIAFG